MICGAEAQQLKIQDELKDNGKHKDDTEKQDKKEKKRWKIWEKRKGIIAQRQVCDSEL